MPEDMGEDFQSAGHPIHGSEQAVEKEMHEAEEGSRERAESHTQNEYS